METQVEGAKKKRMGWNEASETTLIDMWPSKIDGLRGHRKNGHIYAEMADELGAQGHYFSARYVQVKFQNFTQRYRKEKAAMGVSGGSPSTWSHFEKVYQIIGGFKANAFNELTLESIGDVSTMVPSSSTSPSSPLTPTSPSPGPCTSEPAKKKRKFYFKETLLQEQKK